MDSAAGRTSTWRRAGGGSATRISLQDATDTTSISSNSSSGQMCKPIHLNFIQLPLKK